MNRELGGKLLIKPYNKTSDLFIYRAQSVSNFISSAQPEQLEISFRHLCRSPEELAAIKLFDRRKCTLYLWLSPYSNISLTMNKKIRHEMKRGQIPGQEEIVLHSLLAVLIPYHLSSTCFVQNALNSYLMQPDPSQW